MAFRLLLADDDESIRFILRNRFEAAGILVDEAATGAEAVARIEAAGLDLILLDMHFPDMTGLDVIEQIDRERAPSIIVLSGATGVEWPNGAPPAPVIGTVVKPFDIQSLTARILDFMRQGGPGRSDQPAPDAPHSAVETDARGPLETEAARVHRYGGEFSLVLVETEAIEEIALAEILDSLLRKVDGRFRVERGDWMIVLPETGIAGARQLAGRIRSQVLHRLGLKGRHGLRTGVAAFGRGDDLGRMLQSARDDLTRFSATRRDMEDATLVVAREILLVEDDESLSFLVRMRLSKANYIVRVAGTKKEALAELSVKVPDLILLDVSLPDGDGFEILRLVRRLPETITVPVIMLTAMTTKEDFQRGFEAGANAYIAKPFDPGELMAVIAREITGGHASGESGAAEASPKSAATGQEED